MSDLKPGYRLGNYLILEKTQDFHKGVIYKAIDPSLERHLSLFAIKGAGSEMLNSVLQQLGPLLRIVPLYNTGEEKGFVYVAFTYMEG